MTPSAQNSNGDVPSTSARSPKNGMSMIVIMGVTGSGKSYLINRLAGKKVVEEGSDLDSCTSECAMIPVEVGKSKVLLIDTPGFDDTDRPDSDILGEIARVLAAQYALGFELKGIMYVHRITDVRYSGTNVKTFEVFRRICGDGEALKNVLLVTSRWNEVDEATGAARERQLREKFWAYMVAHGSCVTRFYGDRSSAVGLASQLLVKQAVVLGLQREMIDEAKQLDQTSAGSFVSDGLAERREKCVSEIQDLERLRDQLRASDRRMRITMEEDEERSRQRLRDAEMQQASLHRDVAAEVDRELREGANKPKKSFWKYLPLVPAAVSLFGMFINLPPGTFDSWLDFI